MQRVERKLRRYIKNIVMYGLILLLLLPGSMLGPVPALQAADSDFTYIVNGGGLTATITGYTGTATDITIPDYVGDNDEYEVTAIGSSAFSGLGLTSVVIPDTVISIGSSAFHNNELTSVHLSNSLESIGSNAFNDNALTSVNLPDSLESIGSSAFVDNALTSIIIPDGVTEIGIGAFMRNELASIVLPTSLTVINNTVFQANRLTSVVIPDQVTAIGNNAFASNFTLASVTLPAQLQTIGNSAFSFAQQLELIVIPDQVTTIGNNAFSSNKLTSVSLPTSLISIGNYAFSNNPLPEITIPGSVTSIGMGAFQSNQLTTLDIPDSVVSIGVDAFRNNLLASVNLSGSLTTIAAGAFQTNRLTSLDIPDSVVSIGTDAFRGNWLGSVNLPDSLTTIEQGAFLNNRLTSLNIPDSVVSIGTDAFRLNWLASVNLPGSLTTIAQGVFQSNQLISIDIPDSVVSIGTDAFLSNQLVSVDLSDSLETIGNGAFRMNNLTSITLPRSITAIGSDSFSTNQLTEATLLSGSTVIGGSAFANNQTTASDLILISHPGSELETYADANGHTFMRYGSELFAGLDKAIELLADHQAGTELGDVPQSARDDLQAALPAAQAVADDIENVDPLPLANATDALLDAIETFESLVIALMIDVPANGNYGYEDVLHFSVSYLDAVTVEGDPVIALEIGDAGETQMYEAVYTGDRSVALHTLTFDFEVPAGLLDEDGIGVGDAIVLPAGASITGSGGDPAPLSYTVPDTSGIRIDSGATDAEAVADDLAALEIVYAPGDSAASVTQNVGLATSGSSGTVITWSSSVGAVIAADGTVTRPLYTASDEEVTLTATITKGDESDTKVFNLTVIKQAQTDAEAVADDLAALEIVYAPGDSAASVRQNVGLATSGSSGTVITWSSSDSAVIATDGTVTRPLYTASDEEVTVTATVTKGGESDTKVFNLTVIKQAQTDAEAVADDLAALEIAYAPGDSAASVTQNVGLATSGTSGTVITWSSSDSAVIGTDGTVTRPVHTASDEEVTVTATVTKGGESDTKVFNLTVIKQAQTDAEAVADDLAALEIVYAPGDSAASVTQNVGLATSGSSGTVITWSSSDSAVIATDGTVTRPLYTASDEEVTVTATVTKGDESDTKVFNLTVIATSPPSPPPIDEDEYEDEHEDVIEHENDTEESSSIKLIINGKEHPDLIVSSTNEETSEHAVHVARIVNEEQLMTIMEELDANSTILIDANSIMVTAAIAVEWSWEISRLLFEKSTVVTLDTPAGGLQVNMNALDLAKAEAVLAPGDTRGLKLRILFTSIPEEEIKQQETVSKFQVEVVGLGVQASVAAILEDQQEELLEWTEFATITINLPITDEAESFTTAVRLREDAVIAPVPTYVDDSGTVVIRSRQGGIFMLIHFSPSFTDIAGRWSERDIRDMASRLVIYGTTAETFEPERAMTHAEFAALVVRALSLPKQDGTRVFPDVHVNAWYSSAIETAAAYGLIISNAEGGSRPEHSVTRQEAAVILDRAQALMGIKNEMTELQVRDLTGNWSDEEQIAPWAREALAILYASGIIYGDVDGTVRPLDELKREELAAMLRRMLQTAEWIN